MKLTVLPFSSAEERDAQRWLSRTLATGRDAVDTQSAEILEIIVGVSIRRRPLLSHRWNVRAQKVVR